MKMMNNIRNIFIITAILLLYACKKEESALSLEQIKYNNNQKSYPSTKMDSAQAINSITKQKIQELLDLSVLYSSGNKDTEIDSVMYAQMKNYFLNPDTLALKPLLKELESLKVHRAKINNIEVYKTFKGQDTLDFAQFDVEYFSNHKSIGTFPRNAQFALISTPIQFKKEFKFYFLNFYKAPAKDSTSSGVTK